jgi:CBS-domain-containing membrane protein
MKSINPLYQRAGVRTYTVKELMVPISEYATVPEGSTLFEAILALERAQDEFDHEQYHHRAILILDKKGRVIGKLSQLGVLRALEPKNDDVEGIDELGQFGFSQELVQGLRRRRRLQGLPLKDLYVRTARLRVEDFMQALTEGEYVEQDASLDIAVHQLALGNHLALLVTKEREIVGILRLTDVFGAVLRDMKECMGVRGEDS